ncbi:hypothetical protein CKO35_16795 [Ectothiorhodospira shaposhnikovii]|uniref:DUF3649 domain-containing protein n=1 Tax=Ectothiorhodospira shaposhnikovii TaxID=1054 RepID=UPI0019055D75|nr:DUF3649 domain-containing protein [Ectothiorhodospira shaposhnikovii]MBK1674913.1 hypothetical protein [Ectothiorhodospira shaposhnikovii]
MSRRLHSRLGMFSRIAAAFVGGYALANLLPLALASLLPVSQAERVMIAMLASFAVFVAAILWAFAARRASHAWAGVLLVSAMAGLLLITQGSGGGL